MDTRNKQNVVLDIEKWQPSVEIIHWRSPPPPRSGKISSEQERRGESASRRDRSNRKEVLATGRFSTAPERRSVGRPKPPDWVELKKTTRARCKNVMLWLFLALLPLLDNIQRSCCEFHKRMKQKDHLVNLLHTLARRYKASTSV